jgi:hypothetical protein
LPGKGQHGASLPAFTDDFTRANSDSLGANWTEATGDTDISSNAALCTTASFNQVIAVYSAAAAGVAQYVKATISGINSNRYSGFILRYTNSSSAFYELEFGVTEQRAFWSQWTSVGGTQTDINDQALTFATGDTFGATVTGTGTSTEIRVWVNPTGLPTTASDWNGDATPDATFTTDPSPAADSGTFVGIRASQNNSGTTYDNFFGGGL